MVSNLELLQGAYSNLQDSSSNHDPDKTFIKVKSGSVPVTSWNNPDYWTLAFPCLFPYGIGGCTDDYTKLHTWVKHLLNLNDDRFRTHYSFMFVAHSILNVRRVCKQTRFSISRPTEAGQSTSKQPPSISSKDLKKTYKEIKDSKSQNPYIADPNVRKLFNQLKAVGKNVPGSDFERRSLQHEIKALMVELGLPTFFITINPADFHHPLVLHYAGKKINLDHPFESTNWLPKEERARLVAHDPVAAAKFFNTLVETWLHTILGVTEKSRMNEIGVLGRVSGYYGTVETQGRGSLHLHILVWIHGAKNTDDLVERLQDESGFDIDLRNYLSNIISEQFPGDGSVPSNIIKEKPDTHICCDRPVDPVIVREGDVTIFDEKFTTDLGRIINECNIHKHTTTCYKYGYKNCRFEFERPIVEVAKIENGVIFLQRKKGNGWVNNYNDITSLVMRCNNDIKFICNGRDSKALSFYITDYITKKALSTHNAFPLIIAAQNEIENNIHPCAANPLYTAAQQQNRDLVVKCLNKLTTHSERSGPEVATMLLDKPLHYKSHTFTKVFYTTFVNELEIIQVPLPQQNIIPQTDDQQQPEVADDDDDKHPEDNNNETFTLQSNDDNTSFTLMNQRVDYTLRSRKMNVSLYDFASQYYKGKKPKKGKLPDNASLLSLQHPQFDTHCMTRYNNPYSFKIPVIVGPQFPSKNINPEKYYKLFLILFKPFFDVHDLKTHDTWEISYTFWFATLNDKDRARLANYENNIHAISSGKSQQKEEKEARRKLREEQGLIDVDEKNNYNTFDPYEGLFSPPEGSSTDVEHINDLSLPKTKLNSLGVFALIAVNQMNKHGGLKTPASQADTSTPKTHYIIDNTKTAYHLLGEPTTHKAMKDSINEQKTLAKQADASQPSTTTTSDGKFDDTTLNEISKQFTLNAEQHLAFFKVGQTLLQELNYPETEIQPPQLLAYIGGPGGTGKSQVIKAIQHLFSHCGRSQWLKSSAYTGTAAANISGSTLSSLTKDRMKQKKDKHKSDLRVPQTEVHTLRAEFKVTKFIIIDEVSMISTYQLSKLDARLKQSNSSELPYGGIHLLFFGDFVQYPPVAGSPLYKQFTSIKAKKKDDTNPDDDENDDHDDHDKEKEKKQDIAHHPTGRNLWLQLNFAVFLTQQMRQTDKVYGQILTDLRNNNTKNIDKHIKILQKRQVDHQTADKDAVFANFLDAPLITTRNAVRTAVNFAKTKAQALAQKEKQIVIMAKDILSADTDRLTIKEATELLHEMDNKTGDLIGLLSCVSGMPMVIKKNLATELGVCNGTRCTLSKIVFHPDQEHLDPMSDNAEALIIKKQPLMIIVKIPNPRFKPFVGLAKGEFPVFPTSNKFEFKHWVNGTRTSTRVHRSQFPLLPGYALTGYAAQGGTFEKAVLDLTTPKGKGTGSINPADAYVLLSRMKTRSGLLILRRFDESILARKPDQDMLKEIYRLEVLAGVTGRGGSQEFDDDEDGSPKKRRQKQKQQQQQEQDDDFEGSPKKRRQQQQQQQQQQEQGGDLGGSPKKRQPQQQQQQHQNQGGSPKKKQRTNVHVCVGKCEDPCLLLTK
jgi:hypothetical protein